MEVRIRYPHPTESSYRADKTGLTLRPLFYSVAASQVVLRVMTTGTGGRRVSQTLKISPKTGKLWLTTHPLEEVAAPTVVAPFDASSKVAPADSTDATADTVAAPDVAAGEKPVDGESHE